MNIVFKATPQATWLTSNAYRQRVEDRSIHTRSHYYSERRFCMSLIRRKLEFYGVAQQPMKTILIGGIGDSVAEAKMLVELFPGARELHLIDWHLPNLRALEQQLTASQLGAKELQVFLHYADLRNPATVAPGSIDFAFTNKLFDPYAGEDFTIQCLLAGIAKTLKPGGIIFSFDYPLDESEGDLFYQAAAEVKLTRLAPKVLQNIK